MEAEIPNTDPVVTIRVYNRADGNVAIQATPNFTEMMGIDISGQKWTPAHVYALHMLTSARRFSNEDVGRAKDRLIKSKIIIPKVGRAH